MYKSILKRTVSIITIIAVFATMFSLGIAASAETSAGSASITYSFSGTNASDAGYAEGVITLSSSSSGTYELYWADDEKALDDYYSLAALEFNSSGSKSVKMAYHTAIPANATKLIATKSSKKVSEADAVFSIPTEKQLSYDSGDLLYTFNSYSDVHIDCDGYYKMPNERLADAFEFGVKKNTDFIVSSGDMVTNAGGPDKEWKVYETILSESGYVNPVWEADGNHDMRCGIQSGLTSFIRATGTDSTKENYDKNLPYYYMFEKNSGDLFIFMALENGSSAGQNDEFSDAQLKWVTELIEQNYKSGINIYIVEHAPIHRFGAGDNMDDPYYSGLLRESYPSTVQFKNILIKYKNLIFLSGHTHEDFEMGYNYSNEDGDACHMIHNPSVAGTTKPKENEHSLEYNDGWGFNSQGYYVEAYQKRVVFYGANLEDKNIYPQYCYIMEGSRAKAEINSSTSVNELSGNTVSITDKLTEASDILGAYYTYASYDQYQAVKKLYYQFQNETTADESVAADFDRKIADLKDIGEHTGMPKTYPVGKKYYFENTKSWSKVYAYAWTGKTHNAEWPGVQISSKETLNGKEIYSVEFDTAGQYRNLIFTNGSSQTVDIPLDQYKYNAFRLAGKDSNGKYYVENFDRESGTVSESNTYALLYYVESEHDWSDTSTLFTQKEDGTYQCAYTANKTCNMSCSLYDKTNKVYKSLTASQGVDYDRGTTFNFTLSSMSSRGKSITVRSVPKGETLYINYTPSTENITVSCGAPKAEPNGDMTICEGTSRDTNIPYRSSSNNEETGTEQIYKSDMLTGLKDKKLCSMALYSSDEIEVDVKGMQIYLAEVDFSTMPNGWVDIPANAIKVFDGDYNFAGGKNIIEFKTPFEYKGGNLLVVIQNSAQGVCNEAKEFIGINTETTGVSCYRIGSSNASSASYDTNTSSFLAKCSFEFVDEHLYTVTWNNFDGTLLEKDENLTYGTTPTYDGETPIRQSDDEFTYTFSGWTPEVTKVTCDITYTAKFDQTPINDTDTTTDSEELSDTDTATDSEEVSDTDTATDSEEVSDTDTTTDSEEVSDTDTTTDSEELSDTDTTTDSEELSDTDTATDSEELSDTDTATDSEEVSDTDTAADSEEVSDTDTAADSEEVSDTDTAADSDTESETDTSTDSETDGDTESDVDSDTDSDIQSDTDTDSDTEEDTDITTDTESDEDTDTETDQDTDIVSDTDTEIGSDTETETDTVESPDVPTDNDTETETESDTTTDTETESDTDFATDTETESDTDTVESPDVPTDTDTQAEMDTDITTDTETGSDTDTTTDTDTGSDTDTVDSPDVPTDTDTESDSDTESDPDTETEPELYGDINGDGKVTARDSMIVQRYAIKLAALTDEQFKAADVDKNGQVNAKDALYILRCSINLAVLPIEK